MSDLLQNCNDETMNEHRSDVLQYIEDNLGEIPQPPANTSWANLDVFYLNIAVEHFASNEE